MSAQAPQTSPEDVQKLLTESRERVEELEYLLWNPNAAAQSDRSSLRIPKKSWDWVFKLVTTSVEKVAQPQDLTAPATPDDDKVFAALKTNEDAVDVAASTQAKNWLAGITALITLIATASVLSAPDVGDLSTPQIVLIATSSAVGFVLLALSLWFAYRSAYGTPGVVDKLKVSSPNGLRHYVYELRQKIAHETYRRLRIAVGLAAVGVVFVLAANMITWLPIGQGGGAESKELCVYVTVQGKKIEVMRTAEKNVQVSRSSPGTEFKAC